MRVFFVNAKKKSCGVYQYGKRVSEILKSEERHQFLCREIDEESDFIQAVNAFDPQIIIYNWHESTMKWLTPNLTNNLNETKQLFFFHEGSFPSFFKNDGFVMLNGIENELQKIFSIPRPIFEEKISVVKNDTPMFGSFGFGFENKGFEKICHLINASYDKAIIRLHITNAFYGDQSGDISNRVIQRCRNLITKKNIQLIVTNDYISDEEILKFLSENTANIFLYDEMLGRGLSSVIDYAVSVDTPLIINNSDMFRHLRAERPQISIDQNNIPDIINLGLEPVKFFREKWSHKNFRNKFFDIFQKL
jgi:hypothetical protein